MDRRDVLKAGGLGIPAAAAASQMATSPAAAHETPLLKHPGIDRSRASSVMQRAGLDALLLTYPTNIYYATGIYPLIAKMGLNDTAAVLIPRNPAEPVLLIAAQFSYYYTMVEAGLPDGVEPVLYGISTGGQLAPLFLFSLVPGREPTERERQRREAVKQAGELANGMQDAIDQSIARLGITADTIGPDTLSAAMMLHGSVDESRIATGDSAIRHLRLIKSPYEIERMRMASQRNIAAAVRSARKLRELGRTAAFRREFINEVTQAGNTPVFLVVNGSADAHFDEELPEGTGLLLDAVSEFDRYHGDFGRTVFVGEPPRELARKVAAMGKVWEALKAELKPGMRFSDIRRRGAELLDAIHGPMPIPFNPHSVGLAHTEHPRTDLDGSPLDIILEPGMILSIDMPLMESGPDGTAHLEDLSLITDDGSEVIHDELPEAILA